MSYIPLFAFEVATLFTHADRLGRKLRILATFLRILAKWYFYCIFLKKDPKRERIFGFELEFQSYYQFFIMFREVFLEKSYQFDSKSAAPVVLDCGANVGIATVFFKFYYPKAKIIAFEPDPDTFRYLERNCSCLRGVKCVNAALSSHSGTTNFFVAKSKSNTVRGNRVAFDASAFSKIRVKSAKLSSYIAGPVDFMKMDIEGSETEVVRELASSGKMQSISQGIIEYHHHLGKRKGELSLFLALLEKNGFDYQINARLFRDYEKGKEQSVMLYVYRHS